MLLPSDTICKLEGELSPPDSTVAVASVEGLAVLVPAVVLTRGVGVDWAVALADDEAEVAVVADGVAVVVAVPVLTTEAGGVAVPVDPFASVSSQTQAPQASGNSMVPTWRHASGRGVPSRDRKEIR